MHEFADEQRRAYECNEAARGTFSMIAIRKFGIDPNAMRAILTTHLHGDHFGGLPFFILTHNW